MVRKVVRHKKLLPFEPGRPALLLCFAALLCCSALLLCFVALALLCAGHPAPHCAGRPAPHCAGRPALLVSFASLFAALLCCSAELLCFFALGLLCAGLPAPHCAGRPAPHCATPSRRFSFCGQKLALDFVYPKLSTSIRCQKPLTLPEPFEVTFGRCVSSHELFTLGLSRAQLIIPGGS